MLMSKTMIFMPYTLKIIQSYAGHVWFTLNNYQKYLINEGVYVIGIPWVVLSACT